MWKKGSCGKEQEDFSCTKLLKQLPAFREIVVPAATTEYSASQGADFALSI